MKNRFLLLLFSLCQYFAVSAQGNPEQAVSLLRQKKFTEAEREFQKLLKINKKDVSGFFGYALAQYEKQQAQKESDGAANNYRNFEPYFYMLKQSFDYATLASEEYIKLTLPQRSEIRKYFSVSEDEITQNLIKKVEKEAHQILYLAPYRKTYELLYTAKIYDKETDADTLISLREALINQCTQFVNDYPKSVYLKKVQGYQREILQDYLNVRALRQYGDKSGNNYEKFCNLILEHFDETELKHVIPQFYGAEFGFDERTMTGHANYTKLQKLAKENGMNVIQYLCKLNLHDKGVNDDNQKLYDGFIRAFAPQDIAYIAVQKMAAPLVIAEKWGEAAKIYSLYGPVFPQDINRFKKTHKMLLATDEGTRSLENLGKGVNSPDNDYNPVLSIDGNTLYFARKSAGGGENIFYSKKISGKFRQAQALGALINTRTHEVPLNISADNRTLFIYGNYSTLPEFYFVFNTENQLGKGDVYYSNKTAQGWSKIDVFKFPVNSPSYETGLCMTADGQAVLFSSDRKGATGGHNPNYPADKLYFHGSGEYNLDLYVSVKKGKEWGEPVNLGKVLNTPFAEKNPYLHPDMKTMYFSSDGHYGLGGYDIYMSKRLKDDSWLEWSEPVNLGKAINSPFDDTFYINVTGENALVTTNRAKDGFGKSDIYLIPVAEKFRPEPMTVVTGTVQTSDGKPIDAEVRWEEYPIPETKGSILNDPEDGTFGIPLLKGKNYVYYAEQKSHFGTSIVVNIDAKTTGIIKEDKLELNSVDNKDGAKHSFTMKTLHFDHNSDVIRPESFFDLDRLAKLLKEMPSLKLSIEGHTDSDGVDAFNMDLSKRRTAAVKKYLTDKGGKAGNLQAEGYGETRPVAENGTEEGKQKNRRVEFKIID